ncbi:MAG: DUF3109 family protein [Bacteroidetes bacterium]|nr:DUF3109 family protein [Bacteroidota bacterium]
MIAIDNVLLSDEIIQEHFVCDLQKCKGGCCVDGDCGAPLTKDETKILKQIYPKIKNHLKPEYLEEIEKQGTHTTDSEFGYVTPTVNGGICVYGYTDELGIVKCGIEKAWKEGVIDFRKPISCHLYPIRIKKMKTYEAVNYEPRPSLCAPACALGDKLKVPVYVFLKDALISKYGEEFYQTLEAVAAEYKDKL